MLLADNELYSTTVKYNNNLLNIIELANRNSIMLDTSIADKIKEEYTFNTTYDDLLHNLIFNSGNCSFSSIYIMKHDDNDNMIYNRTLTEYTNITKFKSCFKGKNHNKYINKNREYINDQYVSELVNRIESVIKYSDIIGRKPVFVIPIMDFGTDIYNVDFSVTYNTLLMVLDSMGLSVSTHQACVEFPKSYKSFKFRNFDKEDMDVKILISSNWNNQSRKLNNAPRNIYSYNVRPTCHNFKNIKNLLTPLSNYVIMYFNALTTQYRVKISSNINTASSVPRDANDSSIMHGDSRKKLSDLGLISNFNDIKDAKFIISHPCIVLGTCNVDEYINIKKIDMYKTYAIHDLDHERHALLDTSLRKNNHKTIKITNGENNRTGQRECPD